MSNQSYNYGKDLVKTSSIAGTLGGLAGDFQNGITQGASDLWSGAKNLGNKALGAVGSVVDPAMTAIENTANKAWTGAKNMAADYKYNAGNAFKSDANSGSIVGDFTQQRQNSLAGNTAPKLQHRTPGNTGLLDTAPAYASRNNLTTSPLKPAMSNSGGMASMGKSMGGSAPKSPTAMSNNPSPGMKKSSAYRLGAQMVIQNVFEKESVAPGIRDIGAGVRGIGTLTRDLARAGIAFGRGTARGTVSGADIGSRGAGAVLGPLGERMGGRSGNIAGHGVGGVVGGLAGAGLGGPYRGVRAAYDVLVNNKSIKDAIGPTAKQVPMYPNIGANATEAQRVVGKIGKNTALAGLAGASALTASDLIYNLTKYIPLPQPRRGYTQINPYDFRDNRD